jgi:hypothetical protein
MLSRRTSQIANPLIFREEVCSINRLFFNGLGCRFKNNKIDIHAQGWERMNAPASGTGAFCGISKGPGRGNVRGLWRFRQRLLL